MGHTVIDDKDDDFEFSGPTHRRSNGAGAGSKIVTDWDNAEQCRCAMACLVKGTSVMENDSLKRRAHKDAELAPAWWQSFGFRRESSFINTSYPNDTFTYGAVFKLETPSPRHPSAPEYVVAFRGTMLCHPRYMAELVQDFWVLFNALTDYTRFKETDSMVDELLRTSDSVWLAGHSLGASMALEIGRSQMLLNKARIIPTFLFNPPHVSPAPIIPEESKTIVYKASFWLKFGLTNMMPGYHKRTKDVFTKLAPWVPNLYVNQDDTICRGYYDYFVQRQILYQEHPRFAMTAGRASYRDILVNMFAEKKLHSHLLPSARLWTSTTVKEQAHDLQQWWKSDAELALETMRYGYDPEKALLSASP